MSAHIPVVERPSGTFNALTAAQLTSLDGKSISPAAVVLHDSWTAAERAKYGVYLATPAEVPEGKVVKTSRFERVNGEVVQVIETEDAPVFVPQSVSPRQLKLALLGAGLLDEIEAFVAGSTVPRAAQISWEYAVEYRRDDPMLNQMAGMLDPPISDAQIDQLFTAASQI